MVFVWRIIYINDNGACIVDMEWISMLALIIFDVLVNVSFQRTELH